MENIKTCPCCGATTKQHKHTANKSGSKRYICRNCGKTYTPNPQKYIYSEDERTTAIKTYYECKSGRAVGRLLGMSRSNAVRWIKERAAELLPPNPQTAENTEELVEVIELDEMFHFIKKKELTNTKENVYITLAVTREPRKIVGFSVTSSRSVEQMQGIIDSSPAAEIYYSDGYLMYNSLCYWGVHIVAPGKSETYTVEGVNADLRRYIPGAARRSRCFYRRIDTLVAVMKVFVTAYNRFGEYKLKNRALVNHRPSSNSRLHKYAELPLAFIDFL